MSSRARYVGAFCLTALTVLLLLLLPPLGCQGTCTSSSECASDEFCSVANGACLTSKSLGFCKPKPGQCATLVDVVCGCDGKTYNNACEASIAGASVAGEGACGASCGGISGGKCASGQFCNFKEGACAEPTPEGECKTPPESCPDVLLPVCGCDHKTYDNACKAAQAKVSIFAKGACSCGGPSNIPCEEGRYCAFNPGACLKANPVGTCETPPLTCPPTSKPVCGCDSKVYDNECEAARVKMSTTATEPPCAKSN